MKWDLLLSVHMFLYMFRVYICALRDNRWTHGVKSAAGLGSGQVGEPGSRVG